MGYLEVLYSLILLFSKRIVERGHLHLSGVVCTVHARVELVSMGNPMIQGSNKW